MQYTAGQAAEATGKNIATITRAIKSGKISAKKDDSGAWRIEPAELYRVFSPTAQILRNPKMREDASPAQGVKSPMQDNGLQIELATLRERIKAQDEILADRADTIADLRARLDREGEERRKLAAILTDQTRPAAVETPAADQAAASRRPWWRRFSG
ncbi:hypothetical protein [Paracoccus albus]|uniref:hypothetical protein n=1 Tax=Paracoccus albus TaxID=3017784 RepID=UPI0022F08E5C|nr:hypothetical protein [Paracoccus albus]WBU62396.1 hypothetical protein PAF20_18660 [Paracoccus albus]